MLILSLFLAAFFCLAVILALIFEHFIDKK